MPFQQLVTGTGAIERSASRDSEERKYGHVCIKGSLPRESRNAKVS